MDSGTGNPETGKHFLTAGCNRCMGLCSEDSFAGKTGRRHATSRDCSTHRELFRLSVHPSSRVGSDLISSDPPMIDLSDIQLIVLAPHQMAAFEALVRRHAARMHALARQLVDEGSADDVVQEVFLNIHRNLKTFRGEAQFSTWLHRVALNACYGLLRKRQPEALEAFPSRTACVTRWARGRTSSCGSGWPEPCSSCRRTSRRQWPCAGCRGWTTPPSPRSRGPRWARSNPVSRGRAALRALLTAQGVTAAG